MKTTLRAVTALLCMILWIGCGNGTGKKAGTDKNAGASRTAEAGHAGDDGHGHEGEAGHDGAHAAPGVAPGSYADWCGEHGVPESACTRCDPALAAAFKATHDWCEEHGLPESQCLRCNPGLKIERPAKPQGM